MKCRVVHELSGYGDRRTESEEIDVGSKKDADKRAQDRAMMLQIVRSGSRGPFWPFTVKVVEVVEVQELHA